MSDQNLTKSKNGAIFKRVAAIIMLISFGCAMWVHLALRSPVETDDNVVGLFVEYDELWRIANTSRDLELYDMMRMAFEAGATGLVVRERILAEWEIAGDVISMFGSQLMFHLEMRYGEDAQNAVPGITISPDGTYILTRNERLHEQLFSLLEAKERYPTAFVLGDYLGLATNMHSVERAFLGLGFPLDDLEMAAEIGFYILPRLRTWEPVTEVNLAETWRWVQKIPNVVAIGFNDSTVPGGGIDPDIQDLIAESLEPVGLPLVSFEFFDQTGLGGLAMRLDDGFMRVHAIAENELRNYREFQDAANRFILAATERNMSIIFLRFHGLMNPASSLELNMEFLEFIRHSLESAGLTVGVPQPIPYFSIPFAALFIIGLGVIAAAGWLLLLVAEPFFTNKKWRLPFILLMIFSVLVWSGGLIFMPMFMRKLLALAAAIIIPSLGIILVLKNRDNWPPFAALSANRATLNPSRVKLIIRAAVHLVLMSMFTLAGGLLMSALLSEPPFMVKLDTFVGVTISHIIPLALIPFILWVREEDWYGIMHGTVRSTIKVWQLGLCALMVAAFALFIMRTGNENPDAVMDVELLMRQLLHNILGVRPRTSEFLIGHPIMLVLLYFGYKFKMLPLLIAGTMGQVSIMNTYAHLHTPVLISIMRTAHGLWLGTLIGIIAIIVLEFIFKQVKKLHNAYGTEPSNL